MLHKKTSSILQELGLAKQVRREARSANIQQTQNSDEAPRPSEGASVISSVSSVTAPSPSVELHVQKEEASRPAPVDVSKKVPDVAAATETRSPQPVGQPCVEPSVSMSKQSPQSTAPPHKVSLEQEASMRARDETNKKSSHSLTQAPRLLGRPMVTSIDQVENCAGIAPTKELQTLKATSPPAVSLMPKEAPGLVPPELRATQTARLLAVDNMATPSKQLLPQTLGPAPPKPSGNFVETREAPMMAAEVAGLRWPMSFLEDPRGVRVELTEDAARATRESGVGRGICFLGPLQADATSGAMYFEVEVLELEAQRSQTMAIGFTSSLPAPKPLLAERATDLGQGSILVGYDLPKLFVHGQSVAKICAREWRPLKELCIGDRVGILAARGVSDDMELTVYVNGARKVSVPVPGNSDSTTSMGALPWPGMDCSTNIWGVVDVHGTVRSVRLRRPPAGHLSTYPAALARGGPLATPSRPLSHRMCSTPPPTQGSSLYSPPATQGSALASRPLHSPPPTQGSTPAARALQGLAKGTVRTLEGPEPRPCKRARLPVFSECKCTVHLVKQCGGVTHVPVSDFCIGRDTKVVNLVLDSADAPNMVSRTHARIVSNDGGVQVIDCRSLNGTWVNGSRVTHHVLQSGDTLVIGNPSQCPADFRFTIAVPPNS